MQTDNRDSRPTGNMEERPAATDDAPKFGRLLLVLLGAVLIVVALTFLSEAYYS